MNERPVASGRPLSAAQADRLSALFEAHADRLYRLARRLVPSAEDAWDLLQEAFLKAARSLESIPPGLSNEEAWLVRVLVKRSTRSLAHGSRPQASSGRLASCRSRVR